MRSRFALFAILCVFVVIYPVSSEEARVFVYDGDGLDPMPCRIHLTDSSGTTVDVDSQYPAFRDHFVCSGEATLQLEPGAYHFEIERGHEYRPVSGKLQVSRGQVSDLRVRLERLSSVREEGWWSGDLHIHRPLKDIELLMRAEDLDIGPVITWWNNRNEWKDQPLPDKLLHQFDGHRFYHVMGGEDERGGGALLYFNLDAPLAIQDSKREFPASSTYLAQASKKPGVWVDVEKPFWWDVPIWISRGVVDSIGLANNHMCRSSMYESEAWGKPRDAVRLPAPRGNGYWTQEIYYDLLNSGIRIPPSAGSASGVLPNPVGYNRVYVHVEGALTYEKWWSGLRGGRVFVSNGPLLRVTANGKHPGHIFKSGQTGPLTIDLKGIVGGYDKIESIEIIKNGVVKDEILLKQSGGGEFLGQLTFDSSGWFIIRTIVNKSETFRFASTAPFYVEIGEESRRVSARSAAFFRDWVQERRERIELSEEREKTEVFGWLDKAENFWSDRVAKATAP
jgi:hypothetical protein